MQSVNKVILVGRLTRDPELKDTSGGHRLCKFGLAVTGNLKRDSAGQWVEEPCFLDCTAFDQQNYALGSKLAEQLKKGNLCYIEGKLVLEKWVAQDGTNRQKHAVIVKEFRRLEKRDERQSSPPPSSQASNRNDDIPW